MYMRGRGPFITENIADYIWYKINKSFFTTSTLSYVALQQIVSPSNARALEIFDSSPNAKLIHFPFAPDQHIVLDSFPIHQ
jgi:hypothetical protein